MRSSGRIWRSGTRNGKRRAEQPPLAEILAAARRMPGPWFWFSPETGTQEYALILSDRELNADEAERILRESVEG